MQFLPRTLGTVLAAARHSEGVEVIYVDNASTDGSYEYLVAAGEARVLRRDNVTIATLRNYGARHARGEFLSFLDADCTITQRYFDDAIEVMRTSNAAATGFEVQLPPAPNWIERTWHELHSAGSDRAVHWINSANFFVSRDIFERIGGFREDLRTGEDTEIGQRLIRAGHRLWAASRLKVIHLGNPQSIRAFHRQKLWHGLGMFGTVNREAIDKPTAMMLVHLLATIAGVAVLFKAPMEWPARIFVALGLQLLVPSVTVAYRAFVARRAVNVPRAVFLYWIYYWARFEAFVLVLTGYADRYVK